MPRSESATVVLLPAPARKTNVREKIQSSPLLLEDNLQEWFLGVNRCPYGQNTRSSSDSGRCDDISLVAVEAAIADPILLSLCFAVVRVFSPYGLNLPLFR